MTLNDESFVEAAQALAIRMAGQKAADQQVSRGLEWAMLLRKPDP